MLICWTISDLGHGNEMSIIMVPFFPCSCWQDSNRQERTNYSGPVHQCWWCDGVVLWVAQEPQPRLLRSPHLQVRQGLQLPPPRVGPGVTREKVRAGRRSDSHHTQWVLRQANGRCEWEGHCPLRTRLHHGEICQGESNSKLLQLH